MVGRTASIRAVSMDTSGGLFWATIPAAAAMLRLRPHRRSPKMAMWW